MLWIVYACLLAGLYAAASWWALKVRKIDRRHWAGASLLALWLAGVGGKFLFDAAAGRASANPADTAPSVAWPGLRASADGTSAAPLPVTEDASKRDDKPVVGSVESMIAPLKARLEKHPQDPKGWALLAQSYAYVGDDAGAEQAIARAAALGVDEKALRARVAAVGRSHAHSNWIADALDK